MRWTVALLVLLVLGGCTEPARRTAAPATTAPTADPSTAQATTTAAPTTIPQTTKPMEPATVVRRFYAAINHRDYQTAWALGGKNLGNRTYAAFAAGFADTDHDDLRITAVRGQLVDVRLVATQDGGTRQTIYTGTYRVVGGQIIHGRLRVIRTTGGSSAGTCDPAYPDVCIPPPPPDLDCPDIDARQFTVLPPDPHGLDADNDGIGCER
jgi:limonene-1,2-epoxide hydrolase